MEELQPELRELEPSFRYSAATRHLLKDGLALPLEEVLNRPDYCLFLVHYIDRIRRWKASNSSKLGQRCSSSSSSSPVAGGVSDGRMMHHALGRLVTDGVISILPFVELDRRILASGPPNHADDAWQGESEASSSDYGDGSAPLETPTGGSNQQGPATAAAVRLAWELLLVSKAALSVISCFYCGRVGRDDGNGGDDAMQAAVAAGSEAADAKAIKALMDHRVIVCLPNHMCMVKAAQYVTILLLELGYSCCYSCQGGGMTMAADIMADKTHCKFVVGLLLRSAPPYSSNSPGSSSSSSSRRKIATIAIARFLQYGTLLCPEVHLHLHLMENMNDALLDALLVHPYILDLTWVVQVSSYLI